MTLKALQAIVFIFKSALGIVMSRDNTIKKDKKLAEAIKRGDEKEVSQRWKKRKYSK